MRAGAMIESLESRTLLAATGTRDLLYVRVQFADQSAPPESASTAAKVANQGAALVTNYSGGQLDFRVQTRLVKLNHTTGYYKSGGVGRLTADADAALRKAGVSLSTFEHVSYRYNGFGSTGLGQFGGSRTWIRASSGVVLAHELGHNLGLGHATLADPKSNAKPFGASTRSEYGDRFSNMGSGGTKDWHAHHKWALGWIRGGQVKTLSDESKGRHTFTLAGHDTAATYASNRVYLVRLTLNSTTAYYVSYRRDTDGVLIHRDSPNRPRGGALIDARPNTSSGGDANLRFGQSLVDARGTGTSDDIRFWVTRDGTNAKLVVTLGAPAANA